MRIGRRRGTEEEGRYPSRGVRVQQVFDLLIVNLQKHNTYRTVQILLLSFNALKQLPATFRNTFVVLHFMHSEPNMPAVSLFSSNSDSPVP